MNGMGRMRGTTHCRCWSARRQTTVRKYSPPCTPSIRCVPVPVVDTVGHSQAIYRNEQRLILATDSKYMIDCVNKYWPKWKYNGFKTSSGNQVANLAELRELKHLEDSYVDVSGRVFSVTLCGYIMQVQWEFVYAHTRVDNLLANGNRKADTLAKAGARKTFGSNLNCSGGCCVRDGYDYKDYINKWTCMCGECYVCQI
jgi:ribonuclease HI